jgi:hypothetical protein
MPGAPLECQVRPSLECQVHLASAHLKQGAPAAQPPDCRKDVRKWMYEFSRMYADVRIFEEKVEDPKPTPLDHHDFRQLEGYQVIDVYPTYRGSLEGKDNPNIG